MADPSDIYIGGAYAGYRDHSGTVTTSYTTIMNENASRVRFSLTNRATNTTNITIKYGTTEQVLVPGASFERAPITGGVWVGAILAKGASGGEQLDAEEA